MKLGILTMRRGMATLAIGTLVTLALASCGGGETEELIFELSIAERQLRSGQSEFVARHGDTVSMKLLADEPAEVHVHGYDQRIQLLTGEVNTLTFTADATGSFQITLHVRTNLNDTNAGNHDHDGHAHKDDAAEFALAVLMVQPR